MNQSINKSMLGHFKACSKFRYCNNYGFKMKYLKECSS